MLDSPGIREKYNHMMIILRISEPLTLDFFGQVQKILYIHILGALMRFTAICSLVRQDSRPESTGACVAPGRHWALFPYSGVDFHEFPCHPCLHDEDGKTKRRKDLGNLPSQVSYRHPLSSHHEFRRAGEQTSPQVARAAGATQKWDEGGGLGSGSSSIRRFRLRRTMRARERGETVQRREPP